MYPAPSIILRVQTRGYIMSAQSGHKLRLHPFFHIFKIILFIAGGFLLFRNKKKLFSVVKNGNFIITLAYALIFGFMALLYRLIIAVNWIMQQGGR